MSLGPVLLRSKPKLVALILHRNAKNAARIVLTHPVHAAAAALNVTQQYIDTARLQVRDDKVGSVGYGGGLDPNIGRLIQEAKAKLDTVMRQLTATMGHFAVAQA